MSDRETNKLSDRESDWGSEPPEQPPPRGWHRGIAQLFKFQDDQTNIRTEG